MRKTLVLAVLVAAAPAWADSFTPYSCQGVVAASEAADIDPALLRPWRELNRDPVWDAAWLARVDDRARRELPILEVAARVRLQHEVVLVAQKIDAMESDRGMAVPRPRGHPLPAHRAWSRTRVRVLALIRDIAPTAKELDALGDHAEPRVAGMLAPALVQRATKTCGSGNSIHVLYTGGLLAFRPLRDEARRALVAQLVAFDRDGHPHVTPLVDAIEMRLGNEVTSPACVVHASDDGTLHPMTLAEIEPSTFVHRVGKGLGCVSCHSTDNAMNARDLGVLELARVDALRDAQVEHAAGAIWRQLYTR